MAQILRRAHGVALWKVGACVSMLAKNVGYSVGRSRRLAPVGLTLFEGNIHKTLVPAPPPRNPELLAGAPSRRASWPIALRTHPPLRRERCRCDPAIAVKIEVKRGRYGRQRFTAVGVDDWLAGAIAVPRSTLAAFLRRRRTSPSSSLTNSVKTRPDRFHLNRGADVSRVFLFVR